ncbi:MAG: MBL fold metallo-hydrolase, partial [Bdellovibrionota bacterium]
MSLKVSRILHAGYIFETENARVVFDPIFENPFSVNCHAFPPISFDEAAIRSLRFDAVFISHIHDDHCSFASLDLFDRKTPIYIYCLYPEMIDLIKALGFECILSLKLDAPVKITDIEITPRRALDADVDSIFHIKSHGLNIL